ncbi:hypothetical protein NLI96_g485 [Meripilus lineatus]|uniref:Angiogenic factor with G patch and FHA domains 1 n=1 Tax=Meripilus lineatus TaxID=2056292 RepID=A0AAD5VGH8_9APHY|nr:hypothetical protein NLI96_g485 [Physisporinus lineatus]
MEEGEITDESYDPALAWPGLDDEAWEGASTSTSTPYTSNTPRDTGSTSSLPHPSTYNTRDSSLASPTTTLRLLVTRSSILPRSQTLAITDGFAEIQFGRDVAPPSSETPRIRLKEMEVSKLHATIYWDHSRLEWSVVDMGSKHGTFIRSSMTSSAGAGEGSSVSSDPRGARLSPPRVSSVPRRLKHCDELSVGGTTFIVHLHGYMMPCADCTSKGTDEIPLFDNRRTARKHEAANKRKRDVVEPVLTPAGTTERNPKKALTALKRTLLSRHDSSGSSSSSGNTTGQYVDRSARRRNLHRDTPPEALTSMSHQSGESPSTTPQSVISVATPSTPLPVTNIGHRLLLKQGWQPGTVLGVSEAEDGDAAGLVDPVEVVGNQGRMGIGMPLTIPTASESLDWKVEGKQRRWDNLQTISGPGNG